MVQTDRQANQSSKKTDPNSKPQLSRYGQTESSKLLTSGFQRFLTEVSLFNISSCIGFGETHQNKTHGRVKTGHTHINLLRCKKLRIGTWSPTSTRTRSTSGYRWVDSGNGAHSKDSINILGCTCSSKSLTSLLSSIRLIFQRNFRTVAATWLRSDPHQIFYFVSHIVARLFIYLFIFIFIFFILQHCVSRVNTIELCGWWKNTIHLVYFLLNFLFINFLLVSFCYLLWYNLLIY